MSDEILDIARGDASLARVLREFLETLAAHGSDKTREMARDVLDGASLRETATSSVYGDEIGEAFDEFWTKYQKMSPSGRNELDAAARQRLGEPE
ncbi:hypothetical protein [Actinoplanes aureus]|uniref:Uncharacterized protein n=1 Tax=Actinoplanes aureus TaxID=2792083 RepID=A0A931G1B3_9ACTN|nr:hypothetical protein [Actinoplanes aureus]MBG0567703.1 hypothetical protein [Actinoplanes aureus]